MKRRLDIWLLVIIAILTIAVAAVVGKCAFDRRVRSERRTMMSTTAEDVTRRLVETCLNDDATTNKLSSATRAANVERIASTSHLGGGGRVYINRLQPKDYLKAGIMSRYTPCWKIENGERISALELDCGDYRIVITMPLFGWDLADEGNYQALSGMLSLLLSLLLGIFLFSLLFHGFRGFASSLIQMFAFSNVRGRILTIERVLPVVLVGVVIFAVGMSIAYRRINSNVHDYAREVLNRAVHDLDDDIMSCADSMLYFVGSAITEHYRTPERAAQIDVKELMHRYGIDELNIVNNRGVVVKGDLANEGFDFNSNANTQYFLKLLSDERYLSQPFRSAVEDPNIVRKYAGVAFPNHNGFVQIGYEKRRLAREMDFELAGMAKGWTIGKSGFFIIARRTTGEIVSCGHPDFRYRGSSHTLTDVGFNVLDIRGDDSEPFEQVLFGDRCICVSRLVGDYHRIVVAMPVIELQRSIRSSVTVVGGVLLVVLLAALLVTLWFVGTNRQLRQFIDEDRKRREKDMMVARTIQTSSLPVAFPDEPACAINALMDTAREVGGDFYDYYDAPSGRLFVLIADTSGKGIPAAMFMMKARAIIKACVFEYDGLAQVVIEANNRLSDNNDADMFVTAWLASYDRETGEFEFINAGHNPPLVKHADGSVEWIRTRPGLVLAAMGGARYRVEKAHLNRGDTLFLYTDGVTEAMNPAGALYGEERLEKVLRDQRDNFIASVRADVAAFCNGAEQSDDITMTILTRK